MTLHVGLLVCQNGGKCFDGACDCPDGYFGLECEEKSRRMWFRDLRER